MKVCEQLQGRTLKGKRRGTEWNVGELIGQQKGNTPGAFSVGYHVTNGDGVRAFMKVSALSLFQTSDDILGNITRTANAHSFERSILEHCNGNSMDRVVTALDFGDDQIEIDGKVDFIFFLIFEMADGDMRKHVTKDGEMDLLWGVTTLHNMFVATSQLHSGYIAHNDIKPANALIFNKDVQKIADLGRATSEAFPAPHDILNCAGDLRFAPPEQLYPSAHNHPDLNRVQKRMVGDLYNLGSLLHYLITARMITPDVISTMRPEHRPRTELGGSQDSYQTALPYWREALAGQLERLPQTAITRFGPGTERESQMLVEMIVQLCEPDPMLRGNPKNRQYRENPFGLNRYISSLDNVKRRLAVKAA